MNYLGFDRKDLETNGGIYTAKEISSQPDLWIETYSLLRNEKSRISDFIAKFLKEDCPLIILSGAGTSAFIGEALMGVYQKQLGIPVRAIATTDIITHPADYFIYDRPTLLISFARSGDSPESLATVELAEKYCNNLYNLIITCNKDGELARKTNSDNSYVFILPDETNDRSLAMTSSFTSMLLAALLILNINKIDTMLPVLRKLQTFGRVILDKNLPVLKKISEMDFERVVFLGSGSLYGTAHESHLKVQELSDGKVICKFDSFLGFRHGPKAVVNRSTLICYLLSNNLHAMQYELDLIRSVIKTDTGAKTIAIGDGYDAKALRIDFPIQLPEGLNEIPEEFLPVIYILPAQIIGFFKSLNLGLSPDSPSKGGAITRVVQGVKIYAVDPADKISSDI